jgi:hypothetical protein
MATLHEFLLSAPPNDSISIEKLTSEATANRPNKLLLPAKLSLYCRKCAGDRFFSLKGDAYFGVGETFLQDFIVYKCNNCQMSTKTYSIRASRTAETHSGSASKFGELPPYGPTISAELQALLGDSLPLFQNGLKCESEGLGIGAFSYYRRVIEAQRDKLFDQVILVAKKLGAPEDVAKELASAKADRQFTVGLKVIRGGPLQALYIDGHNPLTLLHDAISEGLHGQSDQENMQSAQTIRLLLADFALRLTQLLEDHDEVQAAVASLLKAKLARNEQKKASPLKEAGGDEGKEGNLHPENK